MAFAGKEDETTEDKEEEEVAESSTSNGHEVCIDIVTKAVPVMRVMIIFYLMRSGWQICGKS